MAVETEIKLRLLQGAQHARALLEGHGFVITAPRQLEADQTFDLPAGELRGNGRLLRLRTINNQWTLTYKGPADRSIYKSREEIETGVSNGPAFVQILERLGYEPSFAYDKFRTIYRVPGDEGIVTLDETPIGDFLELEGPGSWIDKTALKLGFAAADYVTSSYAALYEEYRRTKEANHQVVPRDMKFHRP